MIVEVFIAISLQSNLRIPNNLEDKIQNLNSKFNEFKIEHTLTHTHTLLIKRKEKESERIEMCVKHLEQIRDPRKRKMETK